MWDFFPITYGCNQLGRVGNLGDGGKYVCGLQQLGGVQECVVYSFGVNDDISFEV